MWERSGYFIWIATLTSPTINDSPIRLVIDQELAAIHRAHQVGMHGTS